MRRGCIDANARRADFARVGHLPGDPPRGVFGWVAIADRRPIDSKAKRDYSGLDSCSNAEFVAINPESVRDRVAH